MKRITILTGHYGSGKSEIAVNLAIDESQQYLVDLDIINPYFRSRSVRDLLESHGVKIIESTIENATGSDLPFISSKGSRPFVNKDLTAIYDLGGTKHGSKVLIQYRSFIDDTSDIDFLVVVNKFRQETDSTEKVLAMIKELEATSQLQVTGLINNTNLMDYTEEATIQEGETMLKEISQALDIPIVYTFIEEHVKTSKVFAGENRTLVRYLAKRWL